MISHFFIDRPIFAAVLSIAIVLAGVLARAYRPREYRALTSPAAIGESQCGGAHGHGERMIELFLAPAGERGQSLRSGLDTGALAVVVSAIADALSEYGVAHVEMPATAERVWRAIHGPPG